MRKNTKTAIRRWGVCLISWLTLSPLFYYFARRWHLMNMPLRIILVLVSPLFLCIYWLAYCLFYLAVMLESQPVASTEPTEELICYVEEHYSNPEVFEKSTGVRLPRFTVTSIEAGDFYWGLDDTLEIEFDNVLSDEFYNYLDSLVEADGSWIKIKADDYHYLEGNDVEIFDFDTPATGTYVGINKGIRQTIIRITDGGTKAYVVFK